MPQSRFRVAFVWMLAPLLLPCVGFAAVPLVEDQLIVVQQPSAFSPAPPLVAVDPLTGRMTTLVMNRPRGIAFDSSGRVVVSDPRAGALFRVGPGGEVTTISSGELLVDPTGLVVDGSTAYVAQPQAESVVAVDLDSGAQQLLVEGPILDSPFAIGLDSDGTLVVGGRQILVRVDPASPSIIPITNLAFPLKGMVLRDGSALLLGGTIVKRDLTTGVETVITPANGCPRNGIGLGPAGEILMFDSIPPGRLTTVDEATGFCDVTLLPHHAPGVVAAAPNGDLVLGYDGRFVDFSSLMPRITRRADDGTETELLRGLQLSNPVDVAVLGDHRIAVADLDLGVLILDPTTGHPELLLPIGPFLRRPVSIGAESSGHLLVLDAQSDTVVRIDPDAPAIPQILSSGGLFTGPLSMAVSPGGRIFVVQVQPSAGDPTLVEIDPISGTQTARSFFSRLELGLNYSNAPEDDLLYVLAGARLHALDLSGPVAVVDEEIATLSGVLFGLGADASGRPVASRQLGFRWSLEVLPDGESLFEELAGGNLLQRPFGVAIVPPLQGSDCDADGVLDGQDNCTCVPNPDQADANAGSDDDSSLPGVQHYGDACDSDLDDDGITGPSDFFGVFRPCLGADLVAQDACRVADLDGDGAVAPADFFGRLRPELGTAPGPGVSDPAATP